MERWGLVLQVAGVASLLSWYGWTHRGRMRKRKSGRAVIGWVELEVESRPERPDDLGERVGFVEDQMDGLINELRKAKDEAQKHTDAQTSAIGKKMREAESRQFTTDLWAAGSAVAVLAGLILQLLAAW